MREYVKWRRLVALTATGAIAAGAVAGCGSNNNDNSSGGNTKGSGIRAGTGSRAEQATAAGKTAAKEAGGSVKLATKTIGIINFLGGIESSDRLKSTTELAAKDLGWKTIVCDGKGTPTQFVACGNSLLDRGVDGIIEVAIEPGQIQSVLNKAKKQNVPIVQVGGGAVPNGDLSGNYGPDEGKSGQVLTDALIKKLNAVGGGDVAIQDFPAAWGATRTKRFLADVKQPANSKIKITANYQTDAATLVPFTRKAVADQITKNPKLKAFWFTFDTTGQVGGQVVAAKFAGKKFPDRPLVTTFHADLGTLELMRKGDIDFTSEVNYDAAAWEGIDNMAEFFARKTPFMTENQPAYPVTGDLFTYKIVDSSNLPPKGQYVPPKWDVPSFFQAKWKAEFGTGTA